MAGIRKQVRRSRPVSIRRQEAEAEVPEQPALWERAQLSTPRVERVLTDMGIDLNDFEQRYHAAILRRGPGSRTAEPSAGEIEAYKNYQRTHDYSAFVEELGKLHGWERNAGKSWRERTRAVIERLFLWSNPAQ